MTKMQIASYLALIGVAMSESTERGEGSLENCLEAVREAQMIMYSLALAEMAEQIKTDGGKE